MFLIWLYREVGLRMFTFCQPPPPLQKETLLYQMLLIHILESNTTLEKALKSNPALERTLKSSPASE